MKCHLYWCIALLVACAATAVLTKPYTALEQKNNTDPVVVFHSGNPDDGSAELRVGTSNSGARLMRVERSADYEISSDYRWIAVADANGSNSTEFRLFQRQGGLEFKEVKIPDPWDALKRLRRIDGTGCDHQYAVPQRWLDAQTLEVLFNAHGDAEHFVNDAVLFYDVANRGWQLSPKAIQNRN